MLGDPQGIASCQPQPQPQTQPQPSPPASPPTEVAMEVSLEGVSRNSAHDQASAAESNRVVPFIAAAADCFADHASPLNASPTERHVERHTVRHEAHEAPLTADGGETALPSSTRSDDQEENEETGEEESEYVEEEVEVEVPRWAPARHPQVLHLHILTSDLFMFSTLLNLTSYIL